MRLTERVVAILGSELAVAQRLQVSETVVRSWRTGEIDPSWPQFQEMLDILLSYVEALSPV